MNTLDVIQGEPAWHQARAQADGTASEAPAMAGESKHMPRSELLRQKATGVMPEIDAATQRRFDRGHESEKGGRELAEGIVKGDLFPVTAVLTIEGLNLLASLDGVTMMEDEIFEHKLWSEGLAEDVRNGTLSPHYTIQMDQQLLVSGAKRCLFMTSDGTPDKMAWCWYESTQEKFSALIAGWRQFKADLAAYVPSEKAAEVVGRTPETLPALHIVLKGEVSASNLAEFKEVALTAIRSVNRDLKTDQDFADSAKARKWCEDIEARVAAAKDHALSQTMSIDLLFRTMDEVSAEARDVRLALEKLEKARKESRRGEIVAGGVKELRDHMAALHQRTEGVMPYPSVDFGAAIKGLRTFDSMQNAVDTALANAKIAASATADRIQANLTMLREQAADLAFLFPDTQVIVQKATDDLSALIKARIAEHRAAEAKKEEEQRERIRKEEVARIEREQAEKNRKAEADAREAQRLADAAAKPVEPAPVAAAPVAAPVPTPAPAVIQMPTRAAAAPVPATPPSLSLGQIGTRLGFTVTAAFLGSLGFAPAGRERAAVLYHEADFAHICAALVDHIQTIQAKQAA